MLKLHLNLRCRGEKGCIFRVLAFLAYILHGSFRPLVASQVCNPRIIGRNMILEIGNQWHRIVWALIHLGDAFLGIFLIHKSKAGVVDAKVS